MANLASEQAHPYLIKKRIKASGIKIYNNSFIQAHKTYYGMVICPGFWEWILHSNNKDISSIKFVQSELEKGDDELAEWTKDNSHIFLPVDDESTQKAMAQVVNYVSSLPNLKVGAVDQFLKGADPWLIAKAISSGVIVVTQETLDLNAKKIIKIPNVCQHFGVSYINTFELLHILQAQFVMIRV